MQLKGDRDTRAIRTKRGRQPPDHIQWQESPDINLQGELRNADPANHVSRPLQAAHSLVSLGPLRLVSIA
jgi:hypothetical protein